MIITKHLNSPDTLVNSDEYTKLYQQSIADPENFWAEQAEKYLAWDQKWSEVVTGSFENADVRWFLNAKLNVCYNCLDRHLPYAKNKTAIIWEGDEIDENRKLSYQELYEQVCRFANGLKSLGVKEGDRIAIYMPMIPEAIIAMLACARIGAIHSVVFAGFSADALKDRVQDASCSIIITADANKRGGKIFPLKTNIDEIIEQCDSVQHVIVINYLNQPITKNSKDKDYHELVSQQSLDCPPVSMNATDPLFILYTSGSTGKPKGILHGQGGYLLQAAMTFKLVFNYLDNDIFWCTADIGWITGHTYLVYGALANAATTLMFAGVPTYPSPSRFWQIIDKHQVNIFYTAPTAIRALMREGDAAVKTSRRCSLKLLGTVGEPINPNVWLWYYEIVGEKRCPVVDTWWQTETGGLMITAFPGATPLKPGAASLPMFGVELAIADNQGKTLEGEATGTLLIKNPWPGQLQAIYHNPERFKKGYFATYPGYYLTGDGAHRDVDGYYWITGRIDDVLNVSGHRLDTAEIESAIVHHPSIAEAAVVGFAHDIKGQGIFAFVTLKKNIVPDEKIKAEILQLVRKKISAIAIPDQIHWTSDLPKTRSGKIMRRILRKIVNRETENLGDLSTLTNPEIVQKIVDELRDVKI